jgi:hypothetical protein
MMSLVDTLAGEIGQSPAFEEMTEQCRIGTFHALAGDYAEAYGNFVKANNAATQLGKKCIFPAGSDTWKNFREFLAFNVDWIKDKKK